MSRKPAKKQETGVPLNEDEVHNEPSVNEEDNKEEVEEEE